MRKRAVEWLNKPITGKWPPGDELPWEVSIRGRSFVRTMGLPKHDAVAQYREDTETGSRHLYVRPDRTYIIDHKDDHNPHSSPVKHFQHDVLAAFSREMKKQALLGTLAISPLQSLLVRSAMEKQKETPRLKELRKRLTAGDKTRVVVMDETNPMGPHYAHRERGQTIGVRDNEDPAIIAHELGHSELDREMLGSALQGTIARTLPSVGQMAGRMLAYRGDFTIGAAIAAAATAPTLASEGMASMRALKRLEQAGATKEELHDAKMRLLKAFGTYALRPLAAVGDAATFAALARPGSGEARTVPRPAPRSQGR